jgi:hypothetical protein
VADGLKIWAGTASIAVFRPVVIMSSSHSPVFSLAPCYGFSSESLYLP